MKSLFPDAKASKLKNKGSKKLPSRAVVNQLKKPTTNINDYAKATPLDPETPSALETMMFAKP